MAGHSKFKKIKHKKGANDMKKAKSLQRATSAIITAVQRFNNSNPDNNPALRSAIKAARADNIPNVNIQRAIDASVKQKDARIILLDFIWKEYGILIEVFDNCVIPVRKTLTKFGMKAASGLACLFDRVAYFSYESILDEEQLLHQCGDLHLVDIVYAQDHTVALFHADAFGDANKMMSEHFGEPDGSGMTYISKTFIDISDGDLGEFSDVIDLIYEHDGLVGVSSNIRDINTNIEYLI